MTQLENFKKLIGLNVNDRIETRKVQGTDLTYLSWSFAWSEFKQVYPEATYEIVKFVNAKGEFVPYMKDDVGYMVNTKVTADGLTYEMWLPVMNSNNKTLKAEPYEYTTKQGPKSVDACTMFDINKTIMRCLVKNLAMFGLGLYIYAGEDLPDNMESLTPEQKEEKKEAKVKDLAEMIRACATEDELGKIYKAHKSEICSNPTLLQLVTETGKALKKVA